MRAFRKRRWAGLIVNMTPLIDVVFLNIIFFILLINFTELPIKNVQLPSADEAKKSEILQQLKLPITVTSEELIFLDRKKILLGDLTNLLKSRMASQHTLTVQIRADENVPYEIIKKVMLKMAEANISKVEFSTYQETPAPLEKDM